MKLGCTRGLLLERCGGGGPEERGGGGGTLVGVELVWVAGWVRVGVRVGGLIGGGGLDGGGGSQVVQQQERGAGLEEGCARGAVAGALRGQER